MEAIEIVAAVLGLANILLVVRRSVWNFPVALAMVSLYAIVFVQTRLYSDALLQPFFFAVNLYGWRAWLREGGRAGDIRVRRLGVAASAAWLAGILVCTLAWGTAMSRYTDAALPYPDAAVAIASIAAQILLARRFLENWLLWIVVDGLAIGIYWIKGLEPTAVLYALFLALSAWGYAEWRRAPRQERAR